MKNPIIGNRIVNDQTFARRLKGHLNGMWASCVMGEEEIEYLNRVADKLLKYQLETCPIDERSYHENIDGKINWRNPNLRVENQVYFVGEKLPMKVMAMGERFVVCVRPLNKREDKDLLKFEVERGSYFNLSEAYKALKNDKVYSCLDLVSQRRAPHNQIFNPYDFSDRKDCDQLLKDLESGETELSGRNYTNLLFDNDRMH